MRWRKGLLRALAITMAAALVGTGGAVTAIAAVPVYTVTVNCGQFGTCTKSPDQPTYREGDKVTITATADPGYLVDSIDLGTFPIAPPRDSWTFPFPITIASSSLTPKITFKPDPVKYNVDVASPIANGSVKVNTSTAAQRTTVTVTTTPASGYRLKAGSLKANDTPITGTTFVMPAKDVVVSAVFEPITYTLAVNCGANGTCTTTPNKAAYAAGEKVTVTATAKPGYVIEKWLFEEGLPYTTPVGKPSHEYTNAIRANGIFTITFKPLSYPVTISPGIANGTVTATPTTATVGSTVKLTVSPGYGYRLKSGSLKANGTPITGTSFTMPADAVIISAQFEPAGKLFTKTYPAKISGTAKVGKKLTAKVKAWSPAAKFTYQWLRDEYPIAGATKTSYTLTAADLDAKISLEVTGTRSGYVSALTVSQETAWVSLGTLAKGKVKIGGTAKVGKKLTAKPTKWSAKVTYHYQWYRNGKAVPGATAKTYTLTTADAKARLKVKVWTTRDGYKQSASRTSAQTAKVKK